MIRSLLSHHGKKGPVKITIKFSHDNDDGNDESTYWWCKLDCAMEPQKIVSWQYSISTNEELSVCLPDSLFYDAVLPRRNRQLSQQETLYEEKLCVMSFRRIECQAKASNWPFWEEKGQESETSTTHGSKCEIYILLLHAVMCGRTTLAHLCILFSQPENQKESCVPYLYH